MYAEPFVTFQEFLQIFARKALTEAARLDIEENCVKIRRAEMLCVVNNAYSGIDWKEYDKHVRDRF